MENQVGNIRFGIKPSSFKELEKEGISQGTQGSQEALLNIAVKPSFSPNRKIIIGAVATTTGLVVVACVVAVTVVLLASNDKVVDSGNVSDGQTTPNVQTDSTISPTQQTVTRATTLPSNTTIADGQTTTVGMRTNYTSNAPPTVSNSTTMATTSPTDDRQTTPSNVQTDSITTTVQSVTGSTMFSTTSPITVFEKWTTWSSWNGCTVTCGGGIQARTRLCLKSPISDADCVGNNSQSQSCNSFNCPDCTQICSVGTLSADCSRCECTATVTGRVFNGNNYPIKGAIIRETDAPHIILDVTDSHGAFSLNSSCVGKELILSRADYQDTYTILSGTHLEIRMQTIVLPQFTVNPTSKYRLSGEGATICCAAFGNPEIKYYEWLKDGILLSNSMYPNGTHLQLTNLTTSDSGEYVCRANSDAGARKSAGATLSIRDASDDFCDEAYQQKWQRLPDDCVQPDGTTEYEVGTCIAKSCRQNISSETETCGETESSCCGVSDFDIVDINCGDYPLSLFVVKGCSCQACGTKTVRLNGMARGLGTNLPLVWGQILQNGMFVTRTDLNGRFTVTVDASEREVTLTAIDDVYGLFLDSTRKISIAEGFSGTDYIVINMFQKAEPVELFTNIENTLYCGSQLNDSVAPVASIVIPPDSYFYPNGSQYKGVVSASLTYFDPLNETALQNAPGRFEFVDEEGEVQLLATLGVFTMSLQDSSGLRLNVDGGIDVYLNNDIYSSDPRLAEDLKLWGLSPSTGQWEMLMSNEEARKTKRRAPNSIFPSSDHTRLRRQSGFWLGEVGFAHIFSNIDKLTYNEICYFKARVFTNSSFNELPERYIKLLVPIFTSQRYVIYQQGIIAYPSRQCFETRCGYEGFIEVNHLDPFTFKDVSLLPANPLMHVDHGIDSASSTEIKYRVTSSGRVLSLFFKSSDKGPFYKNKYQCEASGLRNNHFKFFEAQNDSDEFTFKERVDFRDFSPINNDDFPKMVARVWYPEFESNKFRACTIRIGLTYQGREKNSIKVRVISYGGTNANVTDKIYGIRTGEVGSTNYICMDYKCSGNLHFLLGSQHDYTKISVAPLVGSTIRCSVVQDNLGDELSGLNTNKVGQRQYTNYVPDFYDKGDGLFAQDILLANQQGILDSIKTDAHNLCRRGSSAAITFSCQDN
ncbi:hypothetical protein ACJMK2_038192 [Sinanodonta woodiana]|uniref:Ig-like domain-containing protein n=1 Tax=Sinanodonta woodiana TaxID=1069815 RepID=A0ABD3WMQ6_SINWO